MYIRTGPTLALGPVKLNRYIDLDARLDDLGFESRQR